MQSNAKRLAKNTAYMYIRMGVNMLIALYSSRVLLQNLGVADYGVYNLVGSIIAMVSMIKGMFSSATQRYLNYEMGKQNYNRLKVIFSMSVMMNLVLALIFVVIVEIIGLWFFAYKINIDPDRIYAAKWVFHLAVLSSVVTIMTSPYDAVTIAHEKMNFFAFISILESVLKLLIILILPFFPYDRLITYAILLLTVSVLIRTIHMLYCHHHFEESYFHRCWDRATFKELFSFAGWQMLGVSSSTITNNGLNMVFNVFGGAVVNAARGIAYQTYGIISQFLNNIMFAITPYSVKVYAEGNKSKMFEVMFFASKVIYAVCLCAVVPLTYATPDVLKIWLGVIPEYSIGFIRLILVWSLFRTIVYPIGTIYKVVGQIKQYQIAEGVILLLPLIASYVALRMGASMYVAFSFLIIFEAINYIFQLFLCHRVAGLNLRHYAKDVLFSVAICTLVGILGYGWLMQRPYASMPAIGLAFVVDCVIVGIMYLYGFNKQEKQALKSLVQKK